MTTKLIASPCQALPWGKLLELSRESYPELALLEVAPNAMAGAVPLRFDMSPRERLAAARERIALLARRIGKPEPCVHCLPQEPGSVFVGSAPCAAQLLLRGEGVSYRHAKLRISKKVLRIVDLEAPGGTFVEGCRIPCGIPCPVVAGQDLRFGACELVLLDAALLEELVLASRGAIAHSTRWQLSAEGMELRELLPQLSRCSLEEFLENAPTPFLLEIPGDSQATEPCDVPHTLDCDMEALLARRPSRGHKHRVRVHSLTPRGEGNVVGRRSYCDVVLPHSSVSKRHAQLGYYAPTRSWRVVDLESSNGTYLGRQRLPPGVATPVCPGDRLSFAGYTVLYLRPRQLYELVTSIKRKKQRVPA